MLSQISEGNTIYQFLNHHYGVRSTALAGTNMAALNSGADIMSNPASIKADESLSLSFSDYLLDTRFVQSVYTKPIDNNRIISFGVLGLFSNDFEHRLEDGLLIGAYSVTELAVFASYRSNQVMENLAAASTLKYVSSTLADYSSQALLFDLAFLYDVDDEKRQTLALNFANIGFQLSEYINMSESLPVNLSIAYAYSLEKAPVKLMLRFKHLEQDASFLKRFESFALGIEITAKESFFIRASYDNKLHNDLQLDNERNVFGGVAFGLGLNKDSHQIDVAYSEYSFLGSRLSLSYSKTFH